MSVEFYVVVSFPGLEKGVGINISIKPYLTNGVITIVWKRAQALALFTRVAKAIFLITYSHHMDKLQKFIPQPKTKMQLPSKNEGSERMMLDYQFNQVESNWHYIKIWLL